MTRITTALLTLALLPLQLFGLDVASDAGRLSTLINNPASVAELRVSGSIDLTDFQFIAEQMPALRTLDLSAAHIAAYSGKPVNGVSASAENTIPQGVFAASALTSVTLPTSGALRIGDTAFAGSSLQSVSIPANTVYVGQGAFSACPQLASVKLSTAETGGYVFKGCAKLVSADLGGATAVGPSDFADCTSLKTVTGTASLSTIGQSAFDGCTALESFSFGKMLKSIGAAAFHNTELQSAALRLASSLGTIGDWAFADNAKLTTVQLPDGVSTLGKGAFFDCRSLESFVLPEGCAALPDYVFKDANALSNISLGENVGKIEPYALKGTSAVGNLTLPATVDSIGSHAMEGMTGLTQIDVTALDHVPALGEKVWDGVNTSAVILKTGDDMIEPFKAAGQWQDFDIQGKSDVNGIVSPSAPLLRGRFAGAVLHIEASGYSIGQIELYDASGKLLTKVSADGADSISIDTGSMAANLFLIRCSLDGDMTATLKLAR